MATHHSEQKDVLCGYLRQNAARSFSIEEIVTELQKQGRCPGKSTVYRLMTQLVQEGRVRRFVRGNGRHFGYQWLTCHGEAHLHCRCLQCGKLYHLDHEASEEMQKALLTVNGFALDTAQTTLMGTCPGCR